MCQDIKITFAIFYHNLAAPLLLKFKIMEKMSIYDGGKVHPCILLNIQMAKPISTAPMIEKVTARGV